MAAIPLHYRLDANLSIKSRNFIENLEFYFNISFFNFGFCEIHKMSMRSHGIAEVALHFDHILERFESLCACLCIAVLPTR